jgi:hypothetical protein
MAVTSCAADRGPGNHPDESDEDAKRVPLACQP